MMNSMASQALLCALLCHITEAQPTPPPCRNSSFYEMCCADDGTPKSEDDAPWWQVPERGGDFNVTSASPYASGSDDCFFKIKVIEGHMCTVSTNAGSAGLAVGDKLTITPCADCYQSESDTFKERVLSGNETIDKYPPNQHFIGPKVIGRTQEIGVHTFKFEHNTGGGNFSINVQCFHQPNIIPPIVISTKVAEASTPEHKDNRTGQTEGTDPPEQGEELSTGTKALIAAIALCGLLVLFLLLAMLAHTMMVSRNLAKLSNAQSPSAKPYEVTHEDEALSQLNTQDFFEKQQQTSMMMSQAGGQGAQPAQTPQEQPVPMAQPPMPQPPTAQPPMAQPPMAQPPMAQP